MKVLPLFVLSSLLLVGCGSGGSSSSASSDSDNPGTPSHLPESGGDDSGTSPGDDNNAGSGGDDNTGGGDEGNTDPSPGDTFAEQMLYAVNQARSQSQVCGSTTMPAVPALEWDYDLESAAIRHSSDMANNGFMSHTGSDGSSPEDRINATGYSWSTWGENVAAGQKSIDAVMAAWMKSEGHCKNIMNGNVTEMGAAFVENPDTQYGIYWTQVFAKPR
ncbi:CAP domain-containing protein (plasmid) [Photobacterium sp. DA100]|uniref:CAP domain-containing protein n=1 Tax=Photobacterium sp. DA100 TaxID=3027472 RepID=UPI00247AB5BC|nr:CAP domain-containing protein [Photobacterium sp. DA100]WEM45542.1 CAP domain-containing protein [Photobacterium sp. DA100]